jgi:hypothetical protein
LTCPDCGLSFPRGVRQFYVWGKPRVTFEQHREFHREEQEARSKPRDPFLSYGTGKKSRYKPPEGAKVHHVVQYADGSFDLPTLPRPTLKDFIRHARKFGTECVYETAEMYLGGKALGRLRIELDAIEAGRKSGGFTVGKRRRRSKQETIAAVLALSEDGLVRSAIPDRLGLSDSRVKQYLRVFGATAAR